MTPAKTLLMKQLTLYVTLLVENTKYEETLHAIQNALFV